MKLEGKTALITGGARGQGRSHALFLAREGADIVVCDLVEDLEQVPYALGTEADLAETVRLVEETGRRCVSLHADVRNSAQVQAAVDACLAEFGHLDIAIANAGIWSAHQLVEMSDESWQTVIDINLTGVFHTIRAAARPMIDQGTGGRIIATSSTAGRAGMMNFGNYVATKWGVLGLIKTAALELAEHSITANAVCPGAVSTDMMFENKALYSVFRPELENPTTADVEETIMSDIHKLPTPWIEAADVSKIVLFLASDDGRYISGTGIDVTAGLSATWGA